MKVGLREKHVEGEKIPTRTFSKRQETDIAQAVGGTRTKNSGATMFDKGDVCTDLFLLEAKTKTSHSESMSVKKE